MMKNKEKSLGQIYTPDYIIDIILDEVGFKDKNVALSTVFEPSFGNGNFLVKIVQRIIDQCKVVGFANDTIAEIINSHVYGNEIDKDAFHEAINRLNDVISLNGLKKIPWDNLHIANTLTDNINYSIVGFDFIIGNPPYVRPHNMDKKTKLNKDKYKFANGTSDLYIMFFERCISELSPIGKLGFITPNSYIKNTSQKAFRDYLLDRNYIEKIIDYKDTQVFDNALVYSAITILNKNKKNKTFTYVDNSNNKSNYSLMINIDSLFRNQKNWTFASPQNTILINEINSRELKLKDICTVQFGVSTNRDSIYIAKDVSCTPNQHNVVFNGEIIEKTMIRDAIKASTCEKKYILFPYTWSDQKNCFVPISEDEMSKKYPLAYRYLKKNKKLLETRDMEKSTIWYQYARSQGLKVNTDKIVVKNIINANESNKEPLCFMDASADTIVYSGLFVVPKDKADADRIKSIISSEEFKQYCILKGKNMSGGYVSINAKTIMDFGIKSA